MLLADVSIYRGQAKGTPLLGRNVLNSCPAFFSLVGDFQSDWSKQNTMGKIESCEFGLRVLVLLTATAWAVYDGDKGLVAV